MQSPAIMNNANKLPPQEWPVEADGHNITAPGFLRKTGFSTCFVHRCPRSL